MPRRGLPAKQRRRAIVIDDSRVMRGLLRRALEQKNFEVSEAENGEDALACLAGMQVPALALVDLNMPHMNGIELVRRLRANRNYKRMVIVMVTSETAPSEIERALDAGADEYLMKPLTVEILYEKLTLLDVLEERR